MEPNTKKIAFPSEVPIEFTKNGKVFESKMLWAKSIWQDDGENR